MFPEYRDLISRLKVSDKHFAKIFDQHNKLDKEIKNINCDEYSLEKMKKEKLMLKDDIYQYLVKSIENKHGMYEK